MRVSFVGQYRGQARGGLGRYEDQLFEQLQRQTEVTYVRAEPVRVPAPVKRFFASLGRDADTLVAAYQVFPDESSCDLIHVANPALAPALLVHRSMPTVVTVHDVLPFLNRPSGGITGRMSQRFLQLLATVGLRRASGIVADSSFTKHELLFRLGLPESKIAVAPLGVDSRVFKPEPLSAAFASRYEIDVERPLVLYIGSQAPRKNLAMLYGAFAQVHSHMPTAQLLVVGSERTSSRTTLEQLHLSDLEDAVRYFGFVPEEDLPPFLNAATLLAFPSLYEGFGLPALEAMACGCPVVAARSTALTEVVGEGGILVEPFDVRAWADAISSVLSTPKLRASLAELGRVRARSFTWERTAEATLACYQDVLQRAA